MNIVCFHNPDEDNGYLSNWYPSSFTVDSVAFSSMEQFMMYRKAICFGDEAVAAQILSTSDVAKIKSLGRQVSNYDESMWNGIRQIVVYEGLLAKFSQNEELKAKLKATGNAVLAECAVKDRIWGIGLSMKDPDRLNKAKWNGQNLLGYALMMVRERLQQDYSWEQRKFSELVQIERGGSPRPIDDFITDAPNGLNWVKIGDAPTQGNYITKTAEKIRPEGLSKTREVHPGDLILSNSMSFGKPYIMGIDGCIHDGWLLIRNTYGVFDLTFLCHLLGTPQMLSQYRSLAAGSTVNNLNKELVGNTYVTIPSITEQRVLGAYLEQLDNLITLHQRELYKYLRYRILKVRRKS